MLTFFTHMLLAGLMGLRVAFVGDPQVDNTTELSYARASIYSELRSRKDLDLVVVLGDLVNDEPSLLGASKESLDSLSCPWICVVGNHDRDTDGVRDSDEFRRILGYEDTTFVMKGVRLICMNDCRLEGRTGYVGGFREGQKKWLDSLLLATPAGTPAVIATHIPLNEFRGSQADSLSSILSHHPRSILVSGHTHCVLRDSLSFSDGSSYCEIVSGASCGSWWRGFPDEWGIPEAWMNSGDPRGYFVADLGKNKINLQYCSVGSDRSASAVLMPDGRTLVNVFGACREGKLEVRTPEGKGWKECERVEEVAPEDMEYLELFKAAGRDFRKAHKELFIPILRYKCEHLWQLPQSLEEGESVKIRYRDPHMRVKSDVTVRTFRNLTLEAEAKYGACPYSPATH